MRRAVTLYIGGERADVSPDGLLLLNYAQSDLANPTIQRNSWSNDVTLPLTPANDKIFGHSFRLDRNAGPGGTGADFNASRKTSFSIYSAAGEILMAGYCKLASVDGDGYKVQLFGGLGDFIYGLAYDADGNKKTLASLDYLGGGDTELDFTINAQAVKDAWLMLESGGAITRSATEPNKELNKDGALTAVTNGCYVDTFQVAANDTYRVYCRQRSSALRAPIVAFDSGGTALQWWKEADANTPATITIKTPPGTSYIKVQGYTSVTPSVTLIAPQFSIINFAPAYNGIPDKDFNADKALAVPTDVGLPATSGTYHASAGGKTLVTLAEKVDEWAAKDLRSYLQRPVLSMRAFLDAVCNPSNNGGWNVTAPAAVQSLFDVWLTRPLLPSLGTYKQSGGDITITATPSAVTSAAKLMTYALADVPAGAVVSFRASLRLLLSLSGSPTADTLYANRINPSDPQKENWSVFFIQAVGYDSGNTAIAASPVTALLPGLIRTDTKTFAEERIGYTPVTITGQETTYTEVTRNTWSKVSSGVYRPAVDFGFEVSGPSIAKVEILVSRYTITIDPLTSKVSGKTTGSTFFPTSGLTATSYAESGGTSSSQGATATTEGSAALRSGALITKQMLLNTERTPADYLLAMCKTFGLYILADAADKTVQILPRGDFFQNKTIDLTARIDKSRGLEIQPLAFDAKWYEFKTEGSGGAFEEEYEQVEGVQYGIQRVDTGYDFDAEVKDVLVGIALRSCASVRGHGRYFYDVAVGGSFRPAPFLLPGCKQTLWNDAGEDTELDISVPGTGATITGTGYDATDRAEFRDADGKPRDGADVLLYNKDYYGAAVFISMADFRLTDDLAEMDTLAGGPCWLLGPGAAALSVPRFSRYAIRAYFPSPEEPLRQDIARSLDFGIPRQIDIPYIAKYVEDATIYARRWKAYIADRLSVHGKVLRCRVILDGLQVGPELLRCFWWYGGSIWVLNKISNYSLTTYDPAECEFIQVRDKNAYLA